MYVDIKAPTWMLCPIVILVYHVTYIFTERGRRLQIMVYFMQKKATYSCKWLFNMASPRGFEPLLPP